MCSRDVLKGFLECAVHEPEKTWDVLAMINELFAIEREGNAGPPEQRRVLRQTRSAEIIARIDAWQRQQHALPQSAFGKALTYTRERWIELPHFIADERVPLHNNARERALRGPVVGRKNFYRIDPSAAWKSRRCSIHCSKARSSQASIRASTCMLLRMPRSMANRSRCRINSRTVER